MIPEARTEERLSWHFLRRRAEQRRGEIWRWQRNSGPSAENTALERSIALGHMAVLGITAETEIIIRKRGKWDARYDVVALLERRADGGGARASFA